MIFRRVVCSLERVWSRWKPENTAEDADWVRSMQRTNVYLEEGQLRALKTLAAEERQSVGDLVRQAVDAFLAKRLASDDDEWRRRLQVLLVEVRARIPKDILPEEIEADITAAREEVRQAHREARGR